MTVTSSHTDTEALTLTLVAEFDAPREKVWEVWEDPRKLERWWGPPTWPATYHQHDFTEGGMARYYMTGPDGEKSRAWMRFTAIDKPNRLEYDDGFADEDDNHVEEYGITHGTVTFESAGSGTRMTIMSTFESLEQLEQMVAMGMEEGMREAMGQIDAVLAA